MQRAWNKLWIWLRLQKRLCCRKCERKGHCLTGGVSGTGCSAEHVTGKNQSALVAGILHLRCQLIMLVVWKTKHCPAPAILVSVESYSPSCLGRVTSPMGHWVRVQISLFLSLPGYIFSISVFIFKRQQQFNQHLLIRTKYKVYNGHSYESCL